MNDWIKTFSEQKGYPVVGKLKKWLRGCGLDE
jgi:hypothetical protein